MMIDAFMSADVDTELSMRVIARPPGGYAEAKIGDKDIICLYHRKNVLENYADNLSKALAQTCHARPATKMQVLKLANRIKEKTRNKRKWIRAHLLTTLIEDYEPPKAAWKQQRRANALKVGIPRQKKVEATETPIEPFKYETKVEKGGCCGCFSSSKSNGELGTDVTAKDLELLKQARSKARNKYKVESPETKLKKGSTNKKSKLAGSPKKSLARKPKGSKQGEEMKVEDLDEISDGEKKKRSLKRTNTSALKKRNKLDDVRADEKRKKDIDNEEDINNSKGNSKKKISKKKQPSINTSSSPMKSGKGKRSPSKSNAKERKAIPSKKSPK